MIALDDAVGLHVITYNRAGYLDRTLDRLLDSRFARCPVAVLDNNSLTRGKPFVPGTVRAP